VIRANPGVRRFSIATSILILAAVPAAAEPPPPAGPSPQPMPYPTPEPLPPPPCTHTICLPQPAAPGAVAAHKHIGQVKYEDLKASEASAAAGEVQVIEAQSASWEAGTLHSADPMEGGQVTARTYRPGKPTYGNLTDAPAMVSEPTAKVAATVTTLAGKLVKGKHLNEVTITTRSGRYTLHDAIVTDVTPAGDGMETVSLSYASKDD
jgi:hypothetical protein